MCIDRPGPESALGYVPDVIVLNPIMTVCWQNRARVCDGLIYQMIFCPALQWLCVDYKDCMWTVWTTMAVCWQTRTRVGDLLILTMTVCWLQWLGVDYSAMTHSWQTRTRVSGGLICHAQPYSGCVLTTVAVCWLQWLCVDRPELGSMVG